MKSQHSVPLSLILILALLVGAHSFSSSVALARSHENRDEHVPPASFGEPETTEFRRGHLGYDGVGDTYLLKDEATPSPHGSDHMLHVKASHWGAKRTLMRFDVTRIPHYMAVTEARLDLFLGYRQPDQRTSVRLYHLLKPWNEPTATWYTTGLEDWSEPGASGAGSDHYAVAFAAATPEQMNAYNSIDVTDAVQRWVQDPAGNHGFIIVGNEPIDLRFWSSDWTHSEQHPRLIVTYELPPDVTPEPTYTPTPTWTPTTAPTSTPTPANIVRSVGDAEAFGASCIETDPNLNASTEVLLVTTGIANAAKLGFWYASANYLHSVQVNGHPVGTLPEKNYSGKCTDIGLATFVEMAFDPAILRSGVNEVTAVNDFPEEHDGWSMANPYIQLEGYVQATDIEVIDLTSSFDGTDRRAMVQVPIGYTPDAVEYPLVIGVHWWGARDFHALKPLAKACNDRGWLLACPDIRRNHHTASKFVQRDIIDLIDYMTEEYSVDPERVYILGTSMGGMMAATTAAKYPHRFAALAELEGPTNLGNWYWDLGELPDQGWRQDMIAAELNGTPNTTPFGYQRGSAAAMPMNLRNVPTIIIHGEQDTLVPFDHAEDLRAGMEAYGAEYVRLYSYEGGHGESHPEWDTDRILAFFSEHTLNTCPLTVTVRTDEAKSYYWLNISHHYPDHWIWVDASFDPGTQTIVVDVLDESGSPPPLSISLDLEKMGLPTSVSYTVEDSNVSTGEFNQYPVQAGARHLILSVPRDHHRLVACPYGAPVPQTLTLRQGEGGYSGVSDTYIEIYASDANHQGDPLRISSGGARTTLLRFDMSPVPPDMVIKGAQLGLCTNYSYPSGAEIGTSVYRVLADWVASQATWENRLSGQAWSTPGALGEGTDYDPASSASQWLADIGACYRYNVTNLVRQWVADPGTNHGMLVRSNEGLGTFTLNSSESPWDKPELIVVFAEPTPTHFPTNTATPTSSPTPFRRTVYLPTLLK